MSLLEQTQQLGERIFELGLNYRGSCDGDATPIKTERDELLAQYNELVGAATIGDVVYEINLGGAVTVVARGEDPNSGEPFVMATQNATRVTSAIMYGRLADGDPVEYVTDLASGFHGWLNDAGQLAQVG